MSKKHFITERLEKLEDINAYYKKIQSTGEFGVGDLTDNLLPILKDLIEENIKVKNEIKKLREDLMPSIKRLEGNG